MRTKQLNVMRTKQLREEIEQYESQNSQYTSDPFKSKNLLDKEYLKYYLKNIAIRHNNDSLYKALNKILSETLPQAKKIDLIEKLIPLLDKELDEDAPGVGKLITQMLVHIPTREKLKIFKDNAPFLNKLAEKNRKLIQLLCNLLLLRI